MSPQTWEQWAGALMTVGGVALAAWTRGGRIYGWCRDRWTAWRTTERKRAEEQQEAERAVRLWKETAASLERESAAKDRRIVDLEHDLAREREFIVTQDARIARKDDYIEALQTRITSLETQLDGSRR